MRSVASKITQFQQISPLKILIAEDNLVNQKLLLRILQAIRYDATVASNEIEVLQEIEHSSFDIIFIDVHMPEMDGLKTSRCIVGKWKEEERPIIVGLTADVLQKDREVY